jgi:ribosome-associated heat shock protein Hsp15
MPNQNASAGVERQRIDKWLWHARVVKARSSAAELVARGRVRVNGMRVSAAGHGIKVGDVLTIALDRRVQVWRVEQFVARRGDAASARRLYTDLAERAESALRADGGPDAPEDGCTVE